MIIDNICIKSLNKKTLKLFDIHCILYKKLMIIQKTFRKQLGTLYFLDRNEFST
jgi:hypothetical protein